ncbi:hypothetical protein E1293_40320 [Actinomadura darangshiensis]|uniref:Uncharacterized protein n=1 Tax=Actinomadura darangshiensis TaxID=705336 RepID=A0A4R5A750_9ACTN|nr:hypothetical protein [Actinomadura darangshiensis]TDD65422.1 hypothetical protein E1293_40320 [Actinomadura darangshiensis]
MSALVTLAARPDESLAGPLRAAMLEGIMLGAAFAAFLLQADTRAAGGTLKDHTLQTIITVSGYRQRPGTVHSLS